MTYAKLKSALMLVAFLAIFGTFAQIAPFQIAIEPMNITNLGGVQSFAWGQHDGKWLIIGGRLDGLHRRQPFAAFDTAGNNNQIIVIDPLAKQKWTTSLSSLHAGLQEQLSSTNMEFHQEGDYLYLVGGYGYSNTAGDHTTFPNLSAVNVPDVINAIINGSSISPSFRQITDTMFAVTGGYLNKIYNTYYLTGGQKFIGRYNPMGPNNGPGFIQIYTNAIRRFTINDNGTTISITHQPEIYDAVNLHRRDYNVVPQISPSGEEELTAFSGVFQVGVNLPFLNCVNIDSSGYTVNNAFTQYYNHYHCAHIPLFSEIDNRMHTIFFGGIAQYYDSAGVLIQDDNVPFVKTIARVTREANGLMSETKLPIEMPSLLGAGSEFIPVETLPKFNNDIFRLDDITSDTTLVGYIYGGISSTAANIFFSNGNNLSSANSEIFKVYLIKKSSVGLNDRKAQINTSLQLQVSPNPSDGNIEVKYILEKNMDVKINIHDVKGKLIEGAVVKKNRIGENTYTVKIKNTVSDSIYFITIETAYEKATRKLYIEK
jgi:hypothetical protein